MGPVTGLAGKVALVTGGANGIGAAVARSLGEAFAAASVAAPALGPSFADTAFVAPMRSVIDGGVFPILDVEDVVDAFFQILDSDSTGECWFVVPGRPSEPFRFRRAPGPRG
jgi:NAD(P)-dependent dehydrogenase (short-subunit alcohol dehydrogenase family)